MDASENKLLKNPETRELTATPSVDSLIADLGDKDRATRLVAHRSLVALGESAVKPLVEALSNPNQQTRSEVDKILDEIKVDWSQHAGNDTIRSLIADLSSSDGFIRVRARSALVIIGKTAVGLLKEALKSKKDSMRWEAAKALEEIGDPGAVDTLITALEDELFDVRWLAAEGLSAIGREALVPLLKVLIERPDSQWIREGAHYVFRTIKDTALRTILLPLAKALEDNEVQLEVPLKAEAALKKLMPS
jgi:HEAT repeat protein